MFQVRQLLVVGAGIAGLATALACARGGARVTVLESALASSFRGHIDIVPNLMRDAAALGIAADCVRCGFAYSGVDLVNESGRNLGRVATEALAGPGLPHAACIGHDEFVAILEQHAIAAGVVLQKGSKVVRVNALGECTLAGGEVRHADLVVLAAGASSELVSSMFGVMPSHGPAQAWWHAILPRPRGLDRLTWMAGLQGRRLLLAPIGMTRAGLAIVRTPHMPTDTSASALSETLSAWGAFARSIAALIDRNAETTVHVTGGKLMQPPWHRDAVLCVGAAAHFLAPPFGQAAAQAFEDALVLGDLVSRRLGRDTLLATFMNRRWPRANRMFELVERGARWVEQPKPETNLVALGKEIRTATAQPA